MAGVVLKQDKYGNDIWFGNPEIKFPVFDFVQDYNQQPEIVKGLKLRADDVINIAYPKSGSNWVNHIIIILQNGALKVPPVMSDNAYIYMDLVGFSTQLPPADRPRALWSHLRFRDLPRDVTEKKVKLVYVTRNPKDVFVSLYCYLKNFSTTSKMSYRGTWAQFFEFVLDEGYWYGDMFDYLRDWEREIENHPEHPILQLSYEEMLKDPVGQVETLNEFLGTGRSQQFCRDVAEACQFSNIPTSRVFHEDAHKTHSWREDLPILNFFRKGKVGDWKNWFTVAQNEQFDKVYRAKMAGSKLRFTFE